MSLPGGARVGPYEVLEPIGRGGMGEVYRARDARLDRHVAIKILPDAVTADAGRLARFDREAKTLAALNHPHIAQIYGVEEFGGGERALVMELVEGEDLSQRIARGPVAPDEALPIARQVAEALEAAHEQGIVHRDLKPANVKLRPDDTVKVLDFGLAKLSQPSGSGVFSLAGDVAQSPTITSPAMMTSVGVVLGTAAYMSPEQARGKPVDSRTDIWGFGCLLYELLTGHRAFPGDDVTDVVAAVVTREPDWTRLPPSTPSGVRRLLRRCLAKDRRNRLPHIGAARLELVEVLAGDQPESGELASGGLPPSGATRRSAALWIGALLAVAVVSGAAGRSYLAPAAAPRWPVQFSVAPPGGLTFVHAPAFLAVAPDGRYLAYVARQDDAAAIWLHSFRDGVARKLPGTERAQYPFWSADAQSVGFIADRKLQTVALDGTGLHTICDVSARGGRGSWNANGVILIADGVIKRVSAAGGVPQAVTVLDEEAGEVQHVRPQFLPDGRRFIFSALNRDTDRSTLRIAELGSGDSRVLDETPSGAEYVHPGYLLFARGGTLLARRFDPGAGAWSGEPFVVSDVVRQQAAGIAAFSASPDGVLAFDTTPGLFNYDVQLVWVTREGIEAGTFASAAGIHTMWLTSDGARAAIEQGTRVGTRVWLLDAERGTRSRLTSESGAQGHPVWSPDGRRIVYLSGSRGFSTGLFIMAASGTGTPESLVVTPPNEPATSKQPTDWSRDGRLIIYEEQHQETGWDINVVPADGDRKPAPVLRSPADERMGQLSPDGRYLAYESNEGGQPDIYVVTFPEVGERWTISRNGGRKPRWGPGGRELLFIDRQGMLQSVAIATAGGFRPGAPKPLFELRAIETDGWNYALAADGQRFLVMRGTPNDTRQQVTVILNWAEGLRSPQ